MGSYRWHGDQLGQERHRLDTLWSADHAWQVSETTCPTCGAGTGERCHDPQGQPLRTHRRRHYLANRVQWHAITWH